MSNQLQENLNLILEEKNTKLLPENLKAGITCLGVTGSLESNTGGGVKLFKTIDELYLDSSAKEGDLAIIYDRKMMPFVEGSDATVFTLPRVVTLDDTPDYNGMTFTCGLGSGNMHLSYNSCNLIVYEESYDVDTGESTHISKISVTWESTDRVVYTMTNFVDESKTLSGDEIVDNQIIDLVSPMTNLNFGNIYGTLKSKDLFLLVDDGMHFEGLYQYDGDTGYVVADNQFTAIDASVAIGESFFGKNGVQNGTLGTHSVSLLLDDAAANAYIKLQQQYDEIDIVGTDSDPVAGLSSTLEIIPNKSDGTSVLNTSNVTKFDGAFEDWKLLKKGPAIDTSKATSMKNMFDSTFELTEVPLYDTSEVTNMYSMFAHSGITTVPLFNTSKVTNMSYMFSGSSLTTAPAFDMSKATNISRMFSSCYSLQNVPQYNWTSVTNVSYVFQFATNLSDESLNNIMGSLLTSSVVSTFKSMGITETLATRCQSLSNYQALVDKGWTTGY